MNNPFDTTATTTETAPTGNEDVAPPSGRHTITINPPIRMRGVEVTRFEVAPISFIAFVEAAFAAVPPGETSRGKIEAAITRRRMVRQVKAFAGDTPVTFEEFDALALPPAIGKKLLDAMRDDPRPEGEVLGKGDGVYSPVLYRLGTPVGATRNGDSVAISEIEFSASTYGHLEEVLVEDQPLLQTAALIQSVGKPVDMMTMPSWVADGISIADGLKIMREVLPRFL